MELYDKEHIYDKEISPLVKQIRAICEEHKIPMIASFSYQNVEGLGVGRCLSHAAHEGREDEVNNRANAILKGGGSSMLISSSTSPA